jgi:hypothetical protein
MLPDSSAVTFATVLIAMLISHQVADHWLQTDYQALNKGRHGNHHENRVGRTACLFHVVSYTACTSLAALSATTAFADVHITPAGFVAGQGISAITHYWADRRFTLARLAALVNKSAYYNLGAPRPGKDDNTTIGTGAYAMDQSFHYLWLGAAAAVMAIM